MGLTERHWFENEDVPEKNEWDLEDAVYNSRTNKKHDDDIVRCNNAGWISVKDRLPENELKVIGYTPVDGYMFIGFHKTEVSFGYDWSSWYIITSMRSTKKITKKVTHWMPLPEPPKEG